MQNSPVAEYKDMIKPSIVEHQTQRRIEEIKITVCRL
jgi:hypothetical protein